MQSERQCPRCEQGNVIRAQVRKTADTIHICDECEAIWFCADSIEYATFGYFNLYMERLGLPAMWDELDYRTDLA